MLIPNGSTSPIMFLMIDSTDHITGKTGLTVTLTISKAGAAFGSPTGSVAEVSSGWYKWTPSGSDTTTNGDLALHATGTGADPTDIVRRVCAFDIDTATHGVDVVSISGDATAADNLEAGYDGTGYAGGTIKQGVDVVAISGDDVAADNFETMLDGTGGEVLSLGQLVIAPADPADPAIDIQAASGGTGININADNGTGVNVQADNGDAVHLYSDMGYGVRVEAPAGTGIKVTANNGETFVLDDGTYGDSVQDELRSVFQRVTAIGASQVTVASPISLPSQAITIYQGDSYYGTKTQKLSWLIPLSGADLTGATVSFKLMHASLFTKACSVTSPGVDGSQVIEVALTAAETAAMTAGSNYKYEVEVSWTTPTEVRTVVVGLATITEQLS